jgi:hypothetical protein
MDKNGKLILGPFFSPEHCQRAIQSARCWCETFVSQPTS